MMQERNKKTK